ncbi:MAG TPA: hypothetical protein VFK33_10360 [Bacillales bacterium]|nr:hypothetical protein [Bacillales bacterium]
MKSVFNGLFSLMLGFTTVYFTSPGIAQAQTAPQVSYPCSVVLQPVRDIPNALGTALIAQVKKPYTDSPTSPVRQRQSVGIYADWLPLPSSFGDYDQYEGFAQIPDVISWRFKMYQIEESVPSWFGGTPWVGKFDEISSGLPENTLVQVRLSNSDTNKLGPVILQNTLKECH